MLCFRHIYKGVFILIHRHKTLTIVRQESRIECAVLNGIVDKLPAAHDIRLRMQFGIEHQIDTQRVLCIRFEQLHIDLSRSSLVSIDNG